MARICCVTNNPRWREITTAHCFEYFDCVEGTAFDVFKKARDLVHMGWVFLGHPLYGNFNPAHMPYRTLLLQGPSEDGKPDSRGIVDMESFAMAERALEHFRGAESKTRTSPMPPKTLEDFSIIDCELMKDTITRYMKHTERTKDKISYGKGYEY